MINYTKVSDPVDTRYHRDLAGSSIYPALVAWRRKCPIGSTLNCEQPGGLRFSLPHEILAEIAGFCFSELKSYRC